MAAANVPAGLTRADEYETQFFGFGCIDVFEALKDTVDAVIRSTGKTLLQSLLKLQSSPESEAVVEKVINELIEKYCESAKGPLENLKEQLPQFFSLPQHLLLPEDKVQENQYTIEELNREKKTLEELKSRLRRAEFLKMMYEAELAQTTGFDQLIDQLTHGLHDLNEIENVCLTMDQTDKAFKKLAECIHLAEVRAATIVESRDLLYHESELSSEEAFLATIQ